MLMKPFHAAGRKHRNAKTPTAYGRILSIRESDAFFLVFFFGFATGGKYDVLSCDRCLVKNGVFKVYSTALRLGLYGVSITRLCRGHRSYTFCDHWRGRIEAFCRYLAGNKSKPMSQITSLAVFCGSSQGNKPRYAEIAIELADYMVDQNIKLVNGGGSVGLMGVMADHVLERGGLCEGVIPQSLVEKEVAHHDMTELHIVPDMHSRKLKMVNLSDAFIALPGGYGTLDELFETLTWLQLHLHTKPIALLNVDGYFDPLIAMADRMVDEGFLKPDARGLLRSATTVQGAINALTRSVQPTREKWH